MSDEINDLGDIKERLYNFPWKDWDSRVVERLVEEIEQLRLKVKG